MPIPRRGTTILNAAFFGFADGRRLMDEWRFGLQWLFVFGRNQFLDVLTRPAGWTNRGSIIKAIASIAVAKRRETPRSSRDERLRRQAAVPGIIC
jgi:hypothetical protein